VMQRSAAGSGFLSVRGYDELHVHVFGQESAAARP
jgi:hypothetical protein